MYHKDDFMIRNTWSEEENLVVFCAQKKTDGAQKFKFSYKIFNFSLQSNF